MYLLNRVVLLFLFFVITNTCVAQGGTEFWFAVPDVGDGRGTWNPPLDTPMYFRISTYDSPATVTISVPANPSFNGGVPIQQTIPANATTTVDASIFKQILSCFHDNSDQNNGVLIASTAPISVYYEVASDANSELWVLKGEHALGTDFYIPGQKAFLNYAQYTNYDSPFYGGNYTVGGYNAFNIIATQDATAVYIFDNSGNTSPTITTTLNTGQTYTVQDFTRTTSSPLTGYRVTTDKPVAITVTDDLLEATGFSHNGQDVGGDQIIPLALIGTEYIVARGNVAENNGDNIAVLAIQNGTSVSRDGSSLTTLNAGQSYNFNLNGASSTYITASAPIYVSQLSSLYGEIGWDVLPTTVCTGSKEVAYTRSASGDCYLILTTQTGNETNFQFLINGIPASINPAFSVVPGTSGMWQSASTDISSLLPLNSVLRVVNTTGLFNMGVVNGVNQAGGRFGYFSDFGAIRITPTANNPGCTDDTLKLFADSLQGATYQWDGPNGFTSNQRNPIITPITETNEGIYILQVTANGCLSIDSVSVSFSALPITGIDIGNDTSYCSSFNRILQVNTSDSIIWSTGETTHSITVNNAGTYWVKVYNQCGIVRDTIMLSQSPIPVVNIGTYTTLCAGNTLILSDTITNATYLWNTNATSASINVTTAGVYWLSVTKNACSSTDTVNINFLLPPTTPVNIGNDTTYCGSFSRTLFLNATTDSILWSTDETTNSITVNSAGIYWVKVYNQCGSVRDTIVLSQNPIPIANLGNNNTACSGTTVFLDATTENATYLWQDNSTNATFTVATEGTYQVTVTANGCTNRDSIKISFVYTITDSLIDTSKCANNILQIGMVSPYANYQWNTGETDAIISARNTGEYTETITNACGQGIRTYNVAEEDCSCHVLFPTAFSPNGDGKNDNFGAVYRCQLSNYRLMIFNRWGELVFSTNDVDGRWDGIYKSKAQPLDVFTFSYQYTDLQTNKKVEGYGNVTLVR